MAWEFRELRCLGATLPPRVRPRKQSTLPSLVCTGNRFIVYDGPQQGYLFRTLWNICRHNVLFWPSSVLHHRSLSLASTVCVVKVPLVQLQFPKLQAFMTSSATTAHHLPMHIASWAKWTNLSIVERSVEIHTRTTTLIGYPHGGEGSCISMKKAHKDLPDFPSGASFYADKKTGTWTYLEVCMNERVYA